jgi:hypothetical protein
VGWLSPVEGATLEMWYIRKGIVGSNPTPTALRRKMRYPTKIGRNLFYYQHHRIVVGEWAFWLVQNFKFGYFPSEFFQILSDNVINPT